MKLYRLRCKTVCGSVQSREKTTLCQQSVDYNENKKSGLMLMRRATASVDSAATSGISVQCVIITHFKGLLKFDAPVRKIS